MTLEQYGPRERVPDTPKLSPEDRKKKDGERARRRKAYLRRIIAVVKDTPCADCSEKYTTQLMTFDHLPEFEKKANINVFVSNKSRRGLFLEMAKCDVVCRPCHDIREEKRGGGW